MSGNRERFGDERFDPAAIHEGGAAELDAFAKKLTPLVHRYFDYVREGNFPDDPNAHEHPDRMRLDGLRIRSIRKSVGLKAVDLVEKMGPFTDHVQLLAYEAGIVPKSDLDPQFTPSLIKVLQAELTQKKPPRIPQQ